MRLWRVNLDVKSEGVCLAMSYFHKIVIHLVQQNVIEFWKPNAGKRESLDGPNARRFMLMLD